MLQLFLTVIDNKKVCCGKYIYYYYTVGWSDLALFSIFENLHIFADQVYSENLNSKKLAISTARASHAWQSVHFFKITGILKINFFLKTYGHLPNTVHQRTIYQKKI